MPESTYGYEQTTDEDGDHHFAGLGESEYDDGSRVTSFAANADVDENGDVTHLDVAAAQFDVREDDGDGWQFGALTASANSIADDEGLHEVGFQANLLEFSHTDGAPEGDAQADDDVFIKRGASLGVGADVRLYDGTDVDGDGSAEYGGGFDIGFATFDARVEEGAIDDAIDVVDTTVTEVSDYASETYDAAAETYEEASESVSESYDETYDDAASAVEDAWDAASAWWDED